VKICVTVDMDNVEDYQRLVGGSSGGGARSFYDDAVPRFLDLFDEVGIRSTFFMVGRDAERAPQRAAVRRIAERGHEVGNHSYTHPYNFRSLSRQRKAEEIDRADAAIADITGARPVGFRTPSFDVDLETLHMLRERGYLYDSSVMPSPLMWIFMLYGRLFIRTREYQLGHPLAVFAPSRPYYPSGTRLHRPARPGERDAPGILEIPGSVVAGLRLPFYATVLRLLPQRVFDLCLRSYRRQLLLNALFHLLDLADLDADGLGGALGQTPGIAVPQERRLRFASHAVRALASAGTGATLGEFARDYTGARPEESH
jgi:peptidoglycan/xylan/chitin deacetylase (PgdA/CDA1 family)